MNEAPAARLLSDIAVQFGYRPVPDAAKAVATHIRTFWEPRMLSQLLALTDSQVADLDERAKAAIGVLRQDAA